MEGEIVLNVTVLWLDVLVLVVILMVTDELLVMVHVNSTLNWLYAAFIILP